MPQLNICDFRSSEGPVGNQTTSSSTRENKLQETKGNPLLLAKALPKARHKVKYIYSAF